MNLFLKNIIRLFIIIIILFPHNLAWTIENKILLKVNNQIITTIDIHEEANYLKALNPNLKSLDEKKIIDIAKSSLIREKIKEVELSKYKETKINQDYLEQIIKSIYTKIGLQTKNEFIKYINDFGISLDVVKTKLTIETHWNQLIYKKFFSKLKVDKRLIVENIKNKKEKSNSYLLYEIVFNINENIADNKIFENIEKSIIQEGFENTAAIYSISESSKTGGNLGWVSDNNINNKILKKIQNLKVGQHTEPILVPSGFLILKIKDKKTIEKKIDIEKETNIRIRSLQNQQLNQYSNIYYKKIKKDILINEK